jgi:methylated-DNA-protein-cysteine methyltransferase-like protein
MAKASDKTIDFFARVYDVVKLVPRGRVTTYGAIAAFLGAKGSARMVGYAMNGLAGGQSKTKGKVPAHRVVNRNGLLTGKVYFGPGRMKQLLEKEGIKVKKDQVQDFDRRFWDPAQHLPHTF